MKIIDPFQGELMQKCWFWSLPYYIHMYITYIYIYNIYLHWERGALQSWQADLITAGNRIYSASFRVRSFHLSAKFRSSIVDPNVSEKNLCDNTQIYTFKIPHVPLSPQQGSSSRWHVKPLPLQSSGSPHTNPQQLLTAPQRKWDWNTLPLWNFQPLKCKKN